MHQSQLLAACVHHWFRKAIMADTLKCMGHMRHLPQLAVDIAKLCDAFRICSSQSYTQMIVRTAVLAYAMAMIRQANAHWSFLCMLASMLDRAQLILKCSRCPGQDTGCLP